MTHYHVTDRRNVAAIVTEGLRIDAMGWNTGYVWMFDDLATAQESAATGAWGGTRGNNAILAVDTTGLGVISDPHPGWGDDRDNHAFAVPHSVEACRVRLVAA